MSNLSDEIEIKNSEILPDNMIYEIFETQYNDLFCKILKITEKSFTYFLHQQVLYNLLIINKDIEPSILSDFQELFTKRYKQNVKSIKKNFELIQNKEKNNETDLTYLDITKCYIHCHNCYNIVHKCGSKLILYDSYIYCLKCNNVYNRNQIMLFCQNCKKNYLTKLRNPVFNGNKKFEKLFILKYKKYHCPSEKEEKIKCLKCSNNLYFRLNQNNPKIEENINNIYCIKCKLKYNLKEVFFKCKICLKNFKCQAKLFRDFPRKKKKLLFTIHTLLRNKNAFPNINLCIKKCNCDLNNITEYYHDDKGKLLEGIKNNKKSIVCNKCFKIYKYEEFDWNCPSCGNIFKYNIINLTKNNKKFLPKKMIKNIPVIKINLNDNVLNEEGDNIKNISKTEESKNEIKLHKNRTLEKLGKMSSGQLDMNYNKEKIKKIFISRRESNNKNNK